MTTDEYNTYLQDKLDKETSFPADIPVKQTIGKLGLMWPQPPFATDHDAIPLLNTYAKTGCPTDCGEDWSHDKIINLLKRGPHRSALSKKATIQLRLETTEKSKIIMLAL